MPRHTHCPQRRIVSLPELNTLPRVNAALIARNTRGTSVVFYFVLRPGRGFFVLTMVLVTMWCRRGVHRVQAIRETWGHQIRDEGATFVFPCSCTVCWPCADAVLTVC